MVSLENRIYDAIKYADSDMAMKILKETSFGESLPDVSNIQNVRSKLLAVAFPELSDALAQDVMQHSVLEFYRLGISFEDHLTNRYLFQGRIIKNEQREMLLRSIQQNNEVLAEKALGEWIQLFDKTYPFDTREPQNIVSFCAQLINKQPQKEREFSVLKDILSAYDRLLALPLIDAVDAVQALRNIRREQKFNQSGIPSSADFPRTNYQESGSGIASQPSPPTPVQPEAKSILNISLKKALEKYPRILGQRVTGADIVFRASDGPVVPSVKNWITAYHQEMGSGAHEPFERSQFLFHNANALKLSQQERNTLSAIFESLDENSELPINIDTQSIDLPSIIQKTSVLTDDMQQMTRNERPTYNTQPVSSNSQLPSYKLQVPSSKLQVPSSAPYRQEAIDDRKDVWNTPTQNVRRETQHSDARVSRPSFQDAHHETHERDVPAFAKEITFTPKQNPDMPTPAPTQVASVSRGPGFAVSAENTQHAPKNDHINPFSALHSDKGRFATTQEARPRAYGSSFSPSEPTVRDTQSGAPRFQTPRFTPQDTNPPRKVLRQTQDHGAPQDYTDYYPIPQRPQTPTASIASRLSFSSPQKFTSETQAPSAPLSTPQTIHQEETPAPTRAPQPAPRPVQRPQNWVQSASPRSATPTIQQRSPQVAQPAQQFSAPQNPQPSQPTPQQTAQTPNKPVRRMIIG